LLYLVAAVVGSIIVWRVAERTGTSPDPGFVQATTFAAVNVILMLVATGGMVNTDVQQGFYRAWFSKPMAPWWFYLQRWLLGGLFVLATPLVYGALLALLLGNGMGVNVALLIQLALSYLLVGSAVFLVSTVQRLDWLIVFILSSAEQGLHGLAQSPIGLPATLDFAYRLLPPFHLIGIGGPTLSGGPLWHVVGYGTGMLALALVVLLTRPLGSGGRA
jgi:hypothetical protein